MRRKLTEAELCYNRYLFGKRAERKRAFESLVLICAKAVGHLTPPWEGNWNPDFHALRHKSRVPWCRRWLKEHLKTWQLDFCQFVGRRCKHALIDAIRKHSSHKARLVRFAGEEDLSPVHVPSPREQMTDALASLNVHLKHQSKRSAFSAAETDFVKASILSVIKTGKPPVKTQYAAQIGKSEGYVRFLAKSVEAKIRLGRAEREEHFYAGNKFATPKDSWRSVSRGSRMPMKAKVSKNKITITEILTNSTVVKGDK